MSVSIPHLRGFSAVCTPAMPYFSAFSKVAVRLASAISGPGRMPLSRRGVVDGKTNPGQDGWQFQCKFALVYSAL